MVVVEGTEVEELDWQLNVCLEISTGMLRRVDAEYGSRVRVGCGVSGVDGDAVTRLSVPAQPVHLQLPLHDAFFCCGDI